MNSNYFEYSRLGDMSVAMARIEELKKVVMSATDSVMRAADFWAGDGLYGATHFTVDASQANLSDVQIVELTDHNNAERYMVIHLDPEDWEVVNLFTPLPENDALSLIDDVLQHFNVETFTLNEDYLYAD